MGASDRRYECEAELVKEAPFLVDKVGQLEIDVKTLHRLVDNLLQRVRRIDGEEV